MLNRVKSLQGLNQKYAYGLMLIPGKVYQNNKFGGRANPEWAWPYLHMEHTQIELNPAHSNTFSQSYGSFNLGTIKNSYHFCLLEGQKW